MSAYEVSIITLVALSATTVFGGYLTVKTILAMRRMSSHYR